MYIRERKCVRSAFLRIKTNRYTLDGTDLIDWTFLVKIRKGDMPAVLVNLDGCNGGGNFLNKGKAALPVFLVCQVNHFLEHRAAQTARIPRHFLIPPLFLLNRAFF